MRVTLYKNSFLASLVSIFGSGFVGGGVIIILSGEVLAGIVLILMGVGLLMAASNISDNKQFKKWLKEAQENNVDDVIRSSVADAARIYNLAPGKPMLKYIRGINPDNIGVSLQLVLQVIFLIDLPGNFF